MYRGHFRSEILRIVVLTVLELVKYRVLGFFIQISHRYSLVVSLMEGGFLVQLGCHTATLELSKVLFHSLDLPPEVIIYLLELSIITLERIYFFLSETKKVFVSDQVF